MNIRMVGTEMASNISSRARTPEGKLYVAMVERSFLDISFFLRQMAPECVTYLRDTNGDLEGLLKIIPESVESRELATVLHFVESDLIDAHPITLAYCAHFLGEDAEGLLGCLRKGFKREFAKPSVDLQKGGRQRCQTTKKICGTRQKALFILDHRDNALSSLEESISPIALSM